MPKQAFSPVRIGPLELAPDSPARVMAILNASPESFHAASVAVGRQAVRDAAEQAAEAGADLVDIGAMSTAPYKETRISLEEERARMGEAVEAARGACGLPITADTMHAEVARVALEAGADAVNDVSALEEDPAMCALIAEKGCTVILMARERAGAPAGPGKPREIVRTRLQEALARAGTAGIQHERLVLDPGIGFFRSQAHSWDAFDLEILRGLEDFAALGHPLLISASRKSFIGRLLGRERSEDRLAGSLAIAVWSTLRGVSVVRTHDPRETRDAIRMAEYLTSE